MQGIDPDTMWIQFCSVKNSQQIRRQMKLAAKSVVHPYFPKQQPRRQLSDHRFQQTTSFGLC